MRAMWLWRAVGKGNPEARVLLASMYAEGNGVAQNCEQARVLLLSAAQQGNPAAQASLDRLGLHGCAAR
jgi:TPR repeat protein